MSSDIQTFEVRVKVKRRGSRHFSSHAGMYIDQAVIKMFHIEARSHEQASQRCEKHGRPISVRKVDVGRIRPISSLVLPVVENPYPDAVAMDEMIWKRKTRRSDRIQNGKQDHQTD